MSQIDITQIVIEVVMPFADENTPTVQTTRFDAGEGSQWYLVAPISDSGDELRSKVVKPARVTGRLTNAALLVYTYDVGDGIDTADLEAGTNSSTGAFPLDDSAQVAQSALVPVNCPNAVLSTVRVQGDDRGQPVRDQVHEVVYQLARQGVRR